MRYDPNSPALPNKQYFVIISSDTDRRDNKLQGQKYIDKGQTHKE